jgi:predicted double-glycine peptidase
MMAPRVGPSKRLPASGAAGVASAASVASATSAGVFDAAAFAGITGIVAAAAAAMLASASLSPAWAAELPIGGGPVSLKVSSLKEARYRSTVRQQYDFSCGSAALATLLTFHYGYPVSEAQAFDEMFRRGDQARIRSAGFSLLDMKTFLAARGLAADGFQQPLDTLASSGYPAIVLIAERGYRHFVVIKGVREGRVLLGDPAGGTRALPRARFEAVWQNRLLFVIHGRVGKPRFNEGSDWAAAPRLRPGDVLARDNLQGITLPKLDAGDF